MSIVKEFKLKRPKSMNILNIYNSIAMLCLDEPHLVAVQLRSLDFKNMSGFQNILYRINEAYFLLYINTWMKSEE